MAHDAQLSFASRTVVVAGVATAGLATRLRLLARPIASTVAAMRPASAGSSGRGWLGQAQRGRARDPRHIRGYRGRAAGHRASQHRVLRRARIRRTPRTDISFACRPDLDW